MQSMEELMNRDKIRIVVTIILVALLALIVLIWVRSSINSHGSLAYEDYVDYENEVEHTIDSDTFSEYLDKYEEMFKDIE